MDSKQFGQASPPAEATVHMDAIAPNDTGNGENSTADFLKPAMGLNNRYKTSKIATQAAGSLRQGTQQLFVHTVPETARNHMEDRQAMWIGLGFIVLLIAALAAQIAYYGKCRQTRVLIASSQLVDCAKGEVINKNGYNPASALDCTTNGGKERKNYRDCKLQLLQHDNEWVLDKQGVWNVNPDHRPAEGVWKVTFVGYTADEAKFRTNIKELVEALNKIIDGQQGKRWTDILNALKYRDIVANGTTGNARISLNLDLGVLVGNKIQDWGQLRDMSQWMTGPLPRSKDNITTMTKGRWFRSSDCQQLVIPHGYNHLQLRRKRAVAVFSTGDFSHDPLSGNFTYVKWLPRPIGFGCTSTAMQFQSSGFSSLGVEILEDIVSYPGRQDQFTLEFDTSQVFLMDWCNNNWERCVEDKCSLERGDKADEEKSKCLQRRFLSLGSTERFPSRYSDSKGRLGFLWNTAFANSAGTGNRTYWVVPELLPDYNCVDCSIPSDGVDCQAFLGVTLHYFRWNDANADPVGDYFTSFEWNLQLDGSFNAENAREYIQCNASPLKFTQDAETLSKSIDIPFDLTKGSAECQLLICRTWIERLSLSFSNVILLYTVMSVAAIMGVMYFRSGYVKANRKRALGQSGGQLMAPGMQERM